VLGCTLPHGLRPGLAQRPRQCDRPSRHGALTHAVTVLGAAGLGSLTDKVWRERQCKYRESQDRVSDKQAAAGAYLSGATAMRCGGGGSTAEFKAVKALRWSATVG
jgi:hypothetical protein